ncbi:MAG TPA: MarR family transcriptional regulator [Gaiellaceae bacterium]|nr:MarR family transcriptional regulator [Gaiellaceae bacterium]
MIADLERAAHLVGAHVERAAQAFGITHAEAHVLALLARERSVSIARLHRASAIKRSTLTNILDRLEGRGLVRRELNPDDRRSFTIHLTRKGAAQARHVVRALDELEATIRAGLGEQDLRGFERVLDAVAAAAARP